MNAQTSPELSVGTVVEFFESKEILLGVCLGVKDQRLNVLTETQREMNLSRRRVLLASAGEAPPEAGRDALLQSLQEIKRRREALALQVRVEELWEVLEGEEEGFDAQVLAELVFGGEVSADHVAAVQRVLLRDRLYFQFKSGLFYARSAEKVEQRRLELEREARREALLDAGSRWLEKVWKDRSGDLPEIPDESLIEKIKDFALFGQEAEESAFVKELFKRAELSPQPNTAFRVLVRLGVWSEDENLHLYRQGIPRDFPPDVLTTAEEKKTRALEVVGGTDRKDLRDWEAFTVDSASTRDFDDALSFQKLEGDRWRIAVHIADAAAYVPPGDPVDQEAFRRATSIYLPDERITMLPPVLSEDLCSLRVGKDRLAVSFLFEVNAEGEIIRSEIVPSVVRIRRQLTYPEVDRAVEEDERFRHLLHFSRRLRDARIERGAVLLPLPEIQVTVNEHGMIHLSRHEKETPSQVIVSEWMIAANGLVASYLAERDLPAIYRCQAECRPETDPVQSDYPIFHMYRRRRLFARAELETRPGPHCSLGMDPYTTATSPIRRYIDLVVQRQLKHALETGKALYSEEELDQMIVQLRAQLGRAAFVHRKWVRYWILKYMEQEDIQMLNALVLDKNSRFAHLLLPDFLMETNAPLSGETPVSAGEMVRIKIERLNPREEILRVRIV